jgi:hypothetical protein
MTAPAQPTITAEQRRELEAIYRQQIGAIRALARLLGYPCPIADRRDRHMAVQSIDTCDTLTYDS